MRQVREILRLKYEQGLAHRAIARACGVGLGTVSEYCGRARQANLTWPLPAEWDDAQLEARLFRRVNDVVGVRGCIVSVRGLNAKVVPSRGESGPNREAG